MIHLPITIEAAHREIKKLRRDLEHAKEQMEADSEAMHMLQQRAQEAVTERDKWLLEKCKTCTRGMKGVL